MTRTPSQNVYFRLAVDEAAAAHPPGESVMLALIEHLRGEGFPVGEHEHWRDAGWEVAVEVGDARIELVIAEGEAEEDAWIGQLYVIGEPGRLAELFGKKAAVRNTEVLRLAHAVDRGVRAAGADGIRWCIDGYPDVGVSTPVPMMPP